MRTTYCACDQPQSMVRLYQVSSDKTDDYVASLPDHLQRGFEPKRYMIAGRPFKEPIAHYRPSVVNTEEKVFQAVQDFQGGRVSDAAR